MLQAGLSLPLAAAARGCLAASFFGPRSSSCLRSTPNVSTLTTRGFELQRNFLRVACASKWTWAHRLRRSKEENDTPAPFLVGRPSVRPLSFAKKQTDHDTIDSTSGHLTSASAEFYAETDPAHGLLLDHMVIDHHKDVPGISHREPVVVIHGLFGSKLNLRSFAKAIKAPRAFLVDLRNHGNSPHTDSMSFREMANDIIKTLDFHDVEKATVVGHSLGGKVAMAVALMYPERVRRCVVLDIAPLNYTQAMDKPTNREGYSTREIVQILASLQDSPKMAAAKSSKDVEALIKEKAPAVSPGMLGFLLQNVHRTDEGFHRWKMNVAGIHGQFDTQIADWPFSHQYEGPTLFVRGERSNFITEDGEKAIKAQFPSSALHTVPGAGHWVHAEASQACLEIINGFLVGQDG
uniref:AB hydrolase-1 domain-containing protein n=1 Tax=Chromera velia CCMP2878 TaxID=1169474 RepID=A0A0G4HHS3_9ALVE|eukprot:Cvel_1056.t1-p1 / transcript=Cvel_1056.t1 / gene=Cvel_1056 / organism=Chromera_velia_CCMP2878 / gene_product=Esterase YbfF, putative / transcript_product=Esterase YbfF, putative / location=Cvel_scaffold34:97906-99123(-) / protein_length=406 / sequence_SO=supercontig / SO=protein_coding / is_pseudo=false